MVTATVLHLCLVLRDAKMNRGRCRVAPKLSFNASFLAAPATSIRQLWPTKNSMKTTLHFRIFIVTVMMIAISCSEPEIAPTGPKKGLPPVPTNEYYTSVTTWTAAGDGTFIGLVSTMLPIDLSKAAVFRCCAWPANLYDWTIESIQLAGYDWWLYLGLCSK